MTTPITLEQLLDIIDGGSPEQRLILAQKLAPNFMPEAQRSGALEDVRQNFWPRVTVGDADVVANSAGAKVWGGPSRFAVLDFPGASAWIDTNDGNTVHIQSPGGGTDCAFDFIVSSCFSTLAGFTEGKVFKTMSGCDLRGFTTFQGVSDWLDANSTNGGAYSVLLCGITGESVTISPGVSGRYGKLHVYGGGNQRSGITGTVTISGVQSSTSVVEFTDCRLPTVTASGAGANYHADFLRCDIDTVTQAGTSSWVGASWLDCNINAAVTSSATSTWASDTFEDCTFGSSFDLSLGLGNTPHSAIYIRHCTFGTPAVIRIKGASNCQIVGNSWGGGGSATASTIQFAVGSTSSGNVIADNVFPGLAAASIAAVDITGAGTADLIVAGNSFPVPSLASAYFLRSASGVTTQVTFCGNEAFATGAGIAVSGKFQNSTFGPNTPANFNLELLTGSSGNLYLGLGTVSGAGASSATVIVSDAQFLTLAAHAYLTSERVFTPRNNAYATDGGAGAAYTFDSWRKGADIASADQLAPGTDGDYFHVTGTTGITSLLASTYKVTALASSPGGYWRLGESSGNAADSSGNGNTATASGGLTYSVTGALAGDPNTAVTFNGTTGYFSAADAASLDLADTFTIEAWVKKGANGTQMTIVSKGTNAYLLYSFTDNKIYLAKTGGANVASSSSTITDTNWHHVVATKSGATVKIYIDGVDVTVVGTAATMADNATALNIGRNVATGTQFWNGSLDEVAVYPTALSAATILDHYNKGVGGLGTGARLLLKFDGACTLTHSASLILQGAVNYTTAAGDVLEFVYEGSNAWREVNRHSAFGISNPAKTAFTPSAVQSIAVSAPIAANATVVQVSTTTAANMTATPTVADGVDGQQLIILNTGANTFTLQDQGTLAGSNLRLTVAGVALATRQSVKLMYSATIGDWVQVGPLVAVL